MTTRSPRSSSAEQAIADCAPAEMWPASTGRWWSISSTMVARCSRRESQLSEREFPAEQFFAEEYAMNLAIAEYPKPYIALMDGVVLGGGIGVSGHGSHRVVTERSRIGMPETTIGLSPDVGGTYLLARAPGELGVHAGITGIHLSAADGIHLGLADTYVPSESLEDLTEALTIRPVDEALADYAQECGPSALADADWVEQAYSHRSLTDVLATLDGLADSVPEAAKTAELLRGKSPTMVERCVRSHTPGSSPECRRSSGSGVRRDSARSALPRLS